MVVMLLCHYCDYIEIYTSCHEVPVKNSNDTLAEANVCHLLLSTQGRAGSLPECRKSVSVPVGDQSSESSSRVRVSPLRKEEDMPRKLVLLTTVTHRSGPAKGKEVSGQGRGRASQCPLFSCENEATLYTRAASLTWQRFSCVLQSCPHTA